MNIAAGVLIIIIALFNLFGGCGYVGGGALGMGVSHISGDSMQELMKGGKHKKEMNVKNKENIERMIESGKIEATGLIGFGIFLFVLFGLEIGAAVVLFMKKAKIFIIAIGGLEVIAESIGIYLTGFGLTNGLGIATGIVAIIAALMIQPKTSEAYN